MYEVEILGTFWGQHWPCKADFSTIQHQCHFDRILRSDNDFQRKSNTASRQPNCGDFRLRA
jgi:hypothetical protein